MTSLVMNAMPINLNMYNSYIVTDMGSKRRPNGKTDRQLQQVSFVLCNVSAART